MDAQRREPLKVYAKTPINTAVLRILWKVRIRTSRFFPRLKLELGDEDEYCRLRDLANRLDEIATRYEHSKLIQLADEYDKRKR
jgi:hypothetical protein